MVAFPVVFYFDFNTKSILGSQGHSARIAESTGENSSAFFVHQGNESAAVRMLCRFLNSAGCFIYARDGESESGRTRFYH